jgi:hypothetical protein
MPFSSVLGASSVIKPGVCTSTTRPTVPYTGQLIFETDTSRLAVWTGSAWVYETAAAGPPGLVYVTGASFTTVTSVSLPNNTFTSTYRNYKIVLHITAAASATAATMRMRANGTDDSSSVYRYAAIGYSSTGAGYNFNNNLTTSWQILETNIDPQPTAMTIDLIAPQVATQTVATGTFIHSNGSYNLMTNVWSARFGNTTQFDAASFLFAGNTSGIYRVYGYTDS